MTREAVSPHGEASPDCGRKQASTSLDEQAPVLLVDDMAVVRVSVATCLQAEGHLVVTAANGEEALELLRNGLTLSLVKTPSGRASPVGVVAGRSRIAKRVSLMNRTAK